MCLARAWRGAQSTPLSPSPLPPPPVAGTLNDILDGKGWGIPATVVAIHWVLAFGWTRGPGEWRVWAWPAQACHAACKDPLPTLLTVMGPSIFFSTG